MNMAPFFCHSHWGGREFLKSVATQLGGESGSRTLWPYYYGLRISNPLHYHPAHSPYLSLDSNLVLVLSICASHSADRDDWRKRWDSNSRTLSDRLFSRQVQSTGLCHVSNKPYRNTLPSLTYDWRNQRKLTTCSCVAIMYFYMAGEMRFELMILISKTSALGL